MLNHISSPEKKKKLLKELLFLHEVALQTNTAVDLVSCHILLFLI